MSSVTAFDTVSLRSMTTVIPLVYIVDDDVSVRESLEALVEEAGWQAESFPSAQEFLDQPRAERPSCLILDVGLPDLTGLEVQERLSGAKREIPIIFVTGRGDIPTTVKAMRAGAAEFLTKPFEPTALTETIGLALERSRLFFQAKSALQVLRDRYQSLSKREAEVMALVVVGRLNKQIGASLGISEITVKAHRGHMMRKMKARSVPELISIAGKLDLAATEKC
jgi:FixJ family two-component response regulator